MCLHPSAPKATREVETGEPQKLMGYLAWTHSSEQENKKPCLRQVQGEE